MFRELWPNRSLEQSFFPSIHIHFSQRHHRVRGRGRIFCSFVSSPVLFARLFELPSAIRKIIYTTNMIESYHNQLRKVTNRKGAFPNEMSLLKLVYLRIEEIRRTWDRPIQNWGQVLNQLAVLFGERVSRHIRF